MSTGTAAAGSWRASRDVRDVCSARVWPSATALTCSRWLGLAASLTVTGRPLRVMYVPSAPRWYFTSPAVSRVSSSPDSNAMWPSNSARIDSGGRPTTWVMKARRPRWAMPITTSPVPSAADSSMTWSVIGTRASTPSMEKVFWPR